MLGKGGSRNAGVGAYKMSPAVYTSYNAAVDKTTHFNWITFFTKVFFHTGEIRMNVLRADFSYISEIK